MDPLISAQTSYAKIKRTQKSMKFEILSQRSEILYNNKNIRWNILRVQLNYESHYLHRN